jgi:hypothetical protein
VHGGFHRQGWEDGCSSGTAFPPKLGVVADVTGTTQPPDLEGLAMVIVMGVYRTFLPAFFADVGSDQETAPQS